MKIVNWDDIIHSWVESINLVGYGSLINPNTHHDDHEYIPVFIEEIKRLYNVQMLPDGMDDDFYDCMFWYHSRNYNITSRDEFNQSIWSNLAVLNCVIWSHGDTVNWVMFSINRSEFEWYALREKQYKLIEIDAYWFEDNKKYKAFVLTCEWEDVIDNWLPFLSYHENTRSWAYQISKEFWKMFDETTYDWWGINLVSTK